MGTNYFAIKDECTCCGRVDEVHICKSLRSFEAPRVWDDDAGEWGDYVLGPSSWAEWKARLIEREEDVVDEYGKRYTAAEFIAMVEDDHDDLARTAEARRRQYDWCVANDPGSVSAGPAIGKTWLDPDGFTFTGASFW